MKKKALDSWYLTGYIATLFLLLLSYTVRYSVFSPAALATAFVAVLYLLFQTEVISRAAYSFIFNTSSLLICLAIFIV